MRSPRSHRNGTARGSRRAGPILGSRRGSAAVLALAGLALALGAAPAAADPHPNAQGGVEVGQAFQVGDLDSVNLFNGALTVALPLGLSYPVNGQFSYRLALVANSNPWDFSSRLDPSANITWQDSAPTACSNAGLGWRVSLGALAAPGMASSHVCVPTDGAGAGGFGVYEAPDGSQHVFYATLHAGEPDDYFNGVQDNAQAFVENVTYSRDGTYLRLKHYTSGNYYEIEFPNGNVHRFDAGGNIVQMRDAFGNQLNISYPNPPSSNCLGIQAGESSCWQLSDSQGRTHWIYFRNDLAPYNGVAPYGSLISRIVLQSVGGAPATYQFSYQAISVRRGCPFNDQLYSDHVSVPVLVSVNQPDGSYFTPGAAGYLQTSGSGCLLGAGSLTGLTLPTLGSLGWTYQQYVYPSASSPRPRHTSNPGVATRSSYDAYGNLIGAWSYATALTLNGANPAVELVNTVTDPLGNQHVRYFSVATADTFAPGANLFDYGRQYTPNTTWGSLYLSEKVIDAGGVVRRTDYLRYERDVIDNLLSERYYGGDNAPFPPTNADLCQQVLPALPEYQLDHTFCSGVECYAQYSGASFFRLHRDIDASTGLVTASYDTANIRTRYLYDAVGRLLYVLPRDGVPGRSTCTTSPRARRRWPRSPSSSSRTARRPPSWRRPNTSMTLWGG
jgi:hypothetical protein